MANINFNVLTYNVQFLPVLNAQDHTTRAKLIPDEILEHKREIDAIVFQEAISDPQRNLLINKLKNDFSYYTDVVGDDTITSQDGGIFIMSKHKIIKSSEFVYPDSFFPDSLAKKGIAYAVILKDGLRFHLFGTHTQAGSQLTWVRNKQIRDMQEFISLQSRPLEEPVIIAGDLNMNRFTREYNQMLKKLDVSFPRSVYGPQFTSDGKNNTFHEDYPNGDQQYLDYTLHSNYNLQPKVSSATTLPLRSDQYWTITIPERRPVYDLSDHYAVLGKFTYDKPPRKDSNKFFGHWQRVKANHNNEPNGPKVVFDSDYSFNAENPGRANLTGHIRNIVVRRAISGNIKVWVNNLNQFQYYDYFFRKNPVLDPYFRPGSKPWEKIPPAYNELVLKSPGLEQTYAFTGHLKDGPDIPGRP